jgi:hypothetical protein
MNARMANPLSSWFKESKLKILMKNVRQIGAFDDHFLAIDAYLREKPDATRKEMIDFLQETVYAGVTRDAAKRYLVRLLEDGRLVEDVGGRFVVPVRRSWKVLPRYKFWTGAKIAFIAVGGASLYHALTLHEFFAEAVSLLLIAVCGVSLVLDDYAGT